MSGGFEQDNLTTVKKILKNFFNEDVNIQNYVDFSYNRTGQDVRYALDDSSLRNIGWNPLRSFDKEIKDIIKYYKNKWIW